MGSKKKTALVISGGGSKGAFAVGVIKSIYERYREDGWFDIVGGTSTGALISPMAALVASKDDSISNEALKTLARIYSDVHTKDILDKENIFQLIFRMHSIYQSDPLDNLIKSEFQQEWFEWLQSKEAPDCYVVYVNYKNGKKVFVSPKDKGITRETFIRAMMASASVPVVMEATIIDKELCYDGGVRDLLPFTKAINMGAKKIIPIFLDPENLNEIKPGKRIDKVLLRTLEILVDEAGKNDYKMAKLINFAIQIKNDLLQTFSEDAETKEKIQAIFKKEKYKDLVGPEKMVLDIIKDLRPDKALTDNSLEFYPEEMRKWMKMGKEKAEKIIVKSPFL